MAVIQMVAAALGSTEVSPVGASEYVVARGSSSSARREWGQVALRAGDVRIREAHMQELAMARAWRIHGGQVCEPLAFHESPAGDVSAWRWVESSQACSFEVGGQTLRRLHEIGAAGVAEAAVFRLRGWRAPEKIARRLHESARADHVHQETLLIAAEICNHLTLQVHTGVRENTTIHGGYQPGNWAGGPGVVAVDFATSCWGPRLSDLTLLASRCGRGGVHSRSEWAEFCRGYGVDPDVLHAPQLRELVWLRELSTLVVGARKPRPEHPNAPLQLHRWCRARLEEL